MTNVSVDRKATAILIALTFVSGAVYAQSYSFDTCTASGRFGPSQSQCDSAYSGTNLEGDVDVAGEGIQEWTVPEGGIYEVRVAGAEGGDGCDSDSCGDIAPGARGAVVEATFELDEGQVLDILVGQRGRTHFSGDGGGGGGGGTFVVPSSSPQSPLLVAGGGAGGTENPGTDSSSRGTLKTSGNGDDDGASGGTDGQGAGGNGGAGLLGNGNSGAQSFINGGVGGDAEKPGGNGGFGGGAGNDGNSGGGGGGYSGGAGIGGCCGDPSGGGGSFIDATALSANTSDGSFSDSSTADDGYSGVVGDLNTYNSGNGYVEVQLVERIENFCDFRSPSNECVMNQTNNLGAKQFNVSKPLRVEPDAAFRAFSGRAIINVTNSTLLSGSWRGEFSVEAENPEIQAGTSIRPRNGDIVIGS